MDNCFSSAPSSSSTQARGCTCACDEPSSLKKRFLKRAKEHRSRLYILKRCIIMLLCWHKTSAKNKKAVFYDPKALCYLIEPCQYHMSFISAYLSHMFPLWQSAAPESTSYADATVYCPDPDVSHDH
ncbi:hypothetical protein VNO78_22548 [Psophocarpus tetragonolobus]|uniref:Uncharacterized protein n=1 Tax=Psophocarpus tetragonolobus TaxID=3891 RepID=A0AAN9S2J5_PSOTE